MAPTQPASSGEADIDIGQLIRWFVKGQLYFWLSFPLAILVSIIAMNVLEPVYTASMLIAPGSSLANTSNLNRAAAPSGLASLVGGGAPGTEAPPPFLQFQALLSSPEVARQLDIKHDFLHIYFKKQWDKDKKVWRVDNTSFMAKLRQWLTPVFHLQARRPPTDQMLATVLDKLIEQSQRERSTIWTISVKLDDPVVARDLLLWVHDEADAIVRQLALEQAQSNLNFLLTGLQATTSSEQRAALTTLLVREELNLMLLQSKTAYSAQIIEPPELPESPSSPRPINVIMISLIGGMVIGGFLSILRGRQRLLRLAR